MWLTSSFIVIFFLIYLLFFLILNPFTSPSPPCYCSFLPLSSCPPQSFTSSFSTLFLLPSPLSSFSLPPAPPPPHKHASNPRWLSWSRSMEPSAGPLSPSTWRGASASSAVSAGTTTWTQRWRRHHGPRRRTGSSTRHMRNSATAGPKSLSCSLAGKVENGEKCEKREAKMNHWILVGWLCNAAV